MRRRAIRIKTSKTAAHKTARQVLTFSLAIAPSDEPKLVWVREAIFVVVIGFFVVTLAIFPTETRSVAVDQIFCILPFSAINSAGVVVHGSAIWLELVCTIQGLLLKWIVTAQAVQPWKHVSIEDVAGTAVLPPKSAEHSLAASRIASVVGVCDGTSCQ